eukprot:903490_1
MNAHQAILKAVRVRSSFVCSKQIRSSAYAFTYAIFHQIHTFICCITTLSHFILMKPLNLISFLDITHDNSLMAMVDLIGGIYFICAPVYFARPSLKIAWSHEN